MLLFSCALGMLLIVFYIDECTVRGINTFDQHKIECNTSDTKELWWLRELLAPPRARVVTLRTGDLWSPVLFCAQILSSGLLAGSRPKLTLRADVCW